MTIPIQSRRLAALLALLVPLPLAAACGGEDGDVVLARDRDGKGGKDAGSSGKAQGGQSASGGSTGLGGGSTGGSAAGGSVGGTSSGGANSGGTSAGGASAGAAGGAQAGSSNGGTAGNAGTAGAGGSTPAAVCGNGVVEAGEQCDDGNIVPGDGCFLCKIDFCGNGKVDAGEVCDGEVPAGTTCASASGNAELNGKLGCLATCAYDYSQCFKSCVSQSQEATLKKKPVDIIFVIDNSGSMTDEITAVQNNISKNFADIIGASGLDYRVIMISKHGNVSAQSICVRSPLSGTSCSPIPSAPANAARFFQYDIEISSTNSFGRITSTFATPAPHGTAPQGWRQWLRPDTFKIFVEITDDNADKTAAQFDAELLALPGGHFGTAAKRNYVFHSIIGLPSKTPGTTPYQPSEPNTTLPTNQGGLGSNAKCNTAARPGPQYQDLSKLTGGLRFPVCNTASYDVVFKQIAEGIVEGSAIECAFAIPPNPAIDRTTLQVEYTPGTGGAKQVFDLAKTQAACAANRVYIEGDTVHLCPAACTTVQGDSGAKLGVLWGCGTGKD